MREDIVLRHKTYSARRDLIFHC